MSRLSGPVNVRAPVSGQVGLMEGGLVPTQKTRRKGSWTYLSQHLGVHPRHVVVHVGELPAERPSARSHTASIAEAHARGLSTHLRCEGERPGLRLDSQKVESRGFEQSNGLEPRPRPRLDLPPARRCPCDPGASQRGKSQRRRSRRRNEAFQVGLDAEMDWAASSDALRDSDAHPRALEPSVGVRLFSLRVPYAGDRARLVQSGTAGHGRPLCDHRSAGDKGDAAHKVMEAAVVTHRLAVTGTPRIGP